MNYTDFKKHVEENILYYLPRSFKDSRIEIKEITKPNNVKLDGLTVIPMIEKKVIPVIYLNDYYSEYTINKDIEAAMFSISSIIKKNKDMDIKLKELEFDDFENKVFLEVINKDLNLELIKKVPYIEYLDLIIIFRYLVKKESPSIQSFIITNELMNYNKLTKNDLLAYANKNTEKLFPYKFTSMEDIVQKMLSGITNNFFEEIESSEDSEEFENLSTNSNMYVLTNDVGVNGASTIVYKDLIKRISDKLNKDLIILPSSVHEVIIVPDDGLNLNELKEMVELINITEVSVSDLLSNNVYKFNRETNEITF